jgi:hypothetical protein
MEQLIEAFGEYVQRYIDNGDIAKARYITNCPEEWYEERIKEFDSVRQLMRDPIFSLIYYIGIENVYWSDINCGLETHYCDILNTDENDTKKEEEDDEHDLIYNSESEDN